MTDRYRNKYRIASARAPFWDYARDGAYFVTICTHDRVCYFGEVVGGEMVLSEIGKIAEWCWTQIPNQFPYAVLDAFIVMPNHVHGIIVIDKTKCAGDGATARAGDGATARAGDGATARRDAIYRVSPPGVAPPGGATGHHNPMLHENLGRIVRWCKARTTLESRKIQADFRWQSRFYDNIIRDDRSFQNIAQYIRDNPAKWTDDRFFKK